MEVKKKMKYKTIKAAFLAMFTTIILLVSSHAIAHSPEDIVLEYDLNTTTLDVTITHVTLDPNSHYVYKVDVKINGELYLSEQYTSQPTTSTFKYSYTVTANVGDEISVTAFCSLFGSLTKTLTVPNENAPDAPEITGPSNGKPGEELQYTFVTTDPNGDDVYYYIEWGDGTNTGWIGPYSSGEGVTESHSWSSKGAYTISAKAKDTDENEGLSGTLTINIPRNKFVFSNFISRNIERISNIFPLLQKIFQQLGFVL
jgi:hypothetical protein